jgi:hypothetical protein
MVSLPRTETSPTEEKLKKKKRILSLQNQWGSQSTAMLVPPAAAICMEQVVG